MVLLGSPTLTRLISYRMSVDPSFNNFAAAWLDTELFPAKFLALDDPYALVLWQNGDYRSVISVSPVSIGVYAKYYKASNVLGREISVDINRLPFTPESDRRIGILFGENKIEILRSSSFQQERVITIEEWSDSATAYEVHGTLLFVPHTSKIVAAKVGERKIVFSDYISAGSTTTVIETLYDNICQVMIPDRHKLLAVLECSQDLIAQYFISDIIGCPPGEHVKSCSRILMYEQVECEENFHWNPVIKKC